LLGYAENLNYLLLLLRYAENLNYLLLLLGYAGNLPSAVARIWREKWPIGLTNVRYGKATGEKGSR
jgi:hypothetical protein